MFSPHFLLTSQHTNQPACEEAIFRLAACAEFHDVDALFHLKRISHASVYLARCLDLPDDFIANLHLAAAMHDVGKIGMPASVVMNPDKYSEQDIAIMRTHTMIGGKSFTIRTSPSFI